MKSGGTFKKRGRPSLLEQCIGESIPDHVANLPCPVTEALATRTDTDVIAHSEWGAERKSDAVGTGLTVGRQAGGWSTKEKARELREYVERNHKELLVPGNRSLIAQKILAREARKPGGGWADDKWLNGADGSVKRNVPLQSSLRRIVAEIIFGKG